MGDIIPGYYVSQKAECVFMFQVSEQVSIAAVKKELPEQMPLYMPLMFRIVDVRGSRIYGSPSKYMLGSTFCTRDKLALKQLHVGSVYNYEKDHMVIQLLDTYPLSHYSVPYRLLGAKATAQQIQ